jgi:hypothetical protein
VSVVSFSILLLRMPKKTGSVPDGLHGSLQVHLSRLPDLLDPQREAIRHPLQGGGGVVIGRPLAGGRHVPPQIGGEKQLASTEQQEQAQAQPAEEAHSVVRRSCQLLRTRVQQRGVRVFHVDFLYWFLRILPQLPFRWGIFSLRFKSSNSTFLFMKKTASETPLKQTFKMLFGAGA